MIDGGGGGDDDDDDQGESDAVGNDTDPGAG